MKNTALFLALSLSIVSFACGGDPENTSVSPNDGSTGGTDGSTGGMTDPFVGSTDPNAPHGKLVMVATVCKMNVYFYESQNGQGIEWLGFWNKNAETVAFSIFDKGLDQYPSKGATLSGQKWSAQNWIDPHFVTGIIETTTPTGPSPNPWVPCETVLVTMPPS